MAILVGALSLVLVSLSALILPGLAVSATPAAAASVGAPRCPPDCGAVAAGDPLLVPFVTVNPGVGWQALPAASVQPFVNALQHNVNRLAGKQATTNVAAGKWDWVAGNYQLLVTLISSTSLASVHLDSPALNARDECTSGGGQPTGSVVSIRGVPGSVSGLCTFRPGSSAAGATVVAFNRGNVAVLIQITSQSDRPIDPRTPPIVAGLQYTVLPPGGVPVSSGSDIEWIVFWLCMLGAVAVGIVLCARRRGSWRGPFQAVAEAFGRRKLALAVSAVAVIGAMAFVMLDASLLHGFGQWSVASFGDLWINWADSAYMTFAGGYGHVYVLDPTLETAPALQVVTAPIARAAFGLSFPYPGVVLYPAAFWVAGPLFLGLMALPICAGDRWLQGMGVSDIRRRLVALAVMGITLPPIVGSGHPEDLVALGAMLYGLVAALEGRSRATGWWLGVALAFQPFAFLAVPIALVFLKKRQWLRAIVPMVAVPLAFLVVPLISEPTVTLSQLIHQKVYYDHGYISPTWNLDPGAGSYIRSLVALAAIPAALVLAHYLPTSRRDAANLVIWVVAALFALRVFEPQLVPYFVAPTLALLPISASRGPWWRLLGTCALAIWLNWWLHSPVQGRWSQWLVIIAQLCVLGWLAFPQRRRRSDERDSDEGRKEPARPKEQRPAGRQLVSH